MPIFTTLDPLEKKIEKEMLELQIFLQTDNMMNGYR